MYVHRKTSEEYSLAWMNLQLAGDYSFLGILDLHVCNYI